MRDRRVAALLRDIHEGDPGPAGVAEDDPRTTVGVLRQVRSISGYTFPVT